VVLEMTSILDRSRWTLLVTGGIVVLALAATGCGTTSPPAAEAAAWMAQHPAAERAGWVDAMILPGGYADVGFAGAAAAQAVRRPVAGPDGTRPGRPGMGYHPGGRWPVMARQPCPPECTPEAILAVLASAGLPTAPASADGWDRTPGIHAYDIPLALPHPRCGLSVVPGPFAGELGERAAAVLAVAGYQTERVVETYSDYYVVWSEGDF
jgi:hypothetical protein